MKKILILSANPKNTEPLRLEEEKREIKAALRRSKSREQFEIVTEEALRVDDLRRALLDHEPQLLHFSGHGGGSDGLVLENNSGKMQFVSTEALARLFKIFKNKVECIFLNACYSEDQAEAIYQHIDHVIGMNQAIGDRAAIKFAVGFYDALGAGRSIEEAFEIGCTSIDLESIPESSTPVLKSKKVQNVAHSVAGDALPGMTPVQANKIDRTQEVVERTTPIAPLEMPEGQVPLDSAFYVERPPIEEECYGAILRPGALIRVKAPRQMGKTSLMSRILNHAAQQGYHTAVLSFQSADARNLTDLDRCLRWFCAKITDELEMDNKLDRFWSGSCLGSKDNCTNYFQRYLLKEVSQPIVLGLDEVDEVFKHPEVAVDFFGLMRAWHEQAKNKATWQKLRLVITHSKEVYIPLNINQSPFNVGYPVELPMLSLEQVQDLASRHGLNWSSTQFEQLIKLLGGHPFLVRTAFYQIAKGWMSLETLEQLAPTEEGPFVDHLHRHLLNLEEDEELLVAARKVFANPDFAQVGATEAFKLRSMGIVRAKGIKVMPLCDLYYQYFHKRLEV